MGLTFIRRKEVIDAVKAEFSESLDLEQDEEITKGELYQRFEALHDTCVLLDIDWEKDIGYKELEKEDA